MPVIPDHRHAGLLRRIGIDPHHFASRRHDRLHAQIGHVEGALDHLLLSTLDKSAFLAGIHQYLEFLGRKQAVLGIAALQSEQAQYSTTHTVKE